LLHPSSGDQGERTLQCKEHSKIIIGSHKYTRYSQQRR
jgi:hypothetical protein